MMNNFKKSEEWKIQLTMKPKFTLLTDSNTKHTMYTKSDKIEIIIRRDTEKSLNNFLMLFQKYIKKVGKNL